MSSVLRFEVPLPPPEARGNNKPQNDGQRHAKNQALETYAAQFGYMAIDARNRSDNPAAWRKLPTAHMTLTFVFPDHRRRDIDNYKAAFKGAQDKLVSCGILLDDSWEHLSTTEVARCEKGVSKVIVEVK